MLTLQNILDTLRNGIGADLAGYVSGGQNSDLNSGETEITAEDVLKIITRGKRSAVSLVPPDNPGADFGAG
jgi:hypothetical protein